MACGREIITLQLGHYANFIGAHWWNIQEAGFEYNAEKPSEINHDVLYREGVTNKDYVTFTPRLLLVDLKESLKHTPKEGELYDQVRTPSVHDAHWPVDKVELVLSPKIKKNEYLEDLENEANSMHDDEEAKSAIPKVYDLDKDVEVWADFCRQRYHPRSVSIINEYEHNNITQPFDVFNYGINIWKTEVFQENYTDQIRHFAEECDNIQGFHILMDATDGFAGLGSSAIEYVEDEYSTKTRLVFPAIPSDFMDTTAFKDGVRTINLALAFCSLAEHSSLFVPLCTGSTGWRQPGPPRQFPNINYNKSLPYHSSAILATALDTVTLRYRLRNNIPSRMSEMTETLNRFGRKAAVASLGLPFAMEYDAYLLETLEKWDGPLWQTLTPQTSLEDDRIWFQSVTLRGISELRLRSPLKDNSEQHDRNPAYTCASIQEMLNLFLSCCSYATASHVTAVETPCKLTPPYPQFFSKYVGLDGSVGSTERPENIGVYSSPTIAGLHSCRTAGVMLESLHAESCKLKMKKFHHFRNSGLEDDEYQECIEQLERLRECYHEEFDV